MKIMGSVVCRCAANKSAWMTAEMFSVKLNEFDKRITKQSKKVVLIKDNCTSHNDPPILKSVKIVFIPPETTEKLQLLDPGITKNFKMMYWKEIVRKILNIGL